MAGSVVQGSRVHFHKNARWNIKRFAFFGEQAVFLIEILLTGKDQDKIFRSEIKFAAPVILESVQF